jgi:uncharacterized protein (DUF305 family)
MSSLIRGVFPAITLGFAAATAFVASAHDISRSVSDICTTMDSGASDEAPFLAENEVAMNKMMNDMAVKPTGDVEVDFVAMMVPHHQGAIDMAIAVLRYGRNPQIRRLAQEIIVTQQQEIAAMRLAVGQPLPPAMPAPDQVAPAGQIDSKNSGPADLMKEP